MFLCAFAVAVVSGSVLEVHDDAVHKVSDNFIADTPRRNLTHGTETDLPDAVNASSTLNSSTLDLEETPQWKKTLDAISTPVLACTTVLSMLGMGCATDWKEVSQFFYYFLFKNNS